MWLEVIAVATESNGPGESEFALNDPLIHCFWVFFLFRIMTYKFILFQFDSSWLICLMVPCFCFISFFRVFSIKVALMESGITASHPARPGTSQNSQLLLGLPTANWWGFLVHKNCRGLQPGRLRVDEFFTFGGVEEAFVGSSCEGPIDDKGDV